MKSSHFWILVSLFVFFSSCGDTEKEEVSKELSSDEFLTQIGVDNQADRDKVKVLLEEYEKIAQSSGGRVSKLDFVKQFEKNLAAAHKSVDKNVHPLAYTVPEQRLWEMTDSIYLAHGIPEAYVDLRISQRASRSN